MTQAQQRISRRRILTGASALPVVAALSIPAASVVLNASDPIYSAITKHRRAFEVWIEALDISSKIEDEPAYERTAVLCHAETEAARQLAGIVPTTIAGVFALLTYVDDCNSGKVRAGEEPTPYDTENWPVDLVDEEIITRFGKPTKMAFGDFVLRNTKTALHSLLGAA